ncbi:hypothetical protein FGU71_12170 [Erythrobacter insulae]|uniref:Uncharacterized protein n=1 Tax=Erythrobacter insulae TaxID=2584124 RepID=A0A547PEG6_9SPHN|nr:hypothetical protein [Erythrobacter insulae]TRD12543.1 hypothetical protein FGU71_12170 [Erythrobacter insulae]
MSASRLQIAIAWVMMAVGVVALFDGYAGYSSGDESIIGWLTLPVAMFLLGGSTLLRSRKQISNSEAKNA